MDNSSDGAISSSMYTSELAATEVKASTRVTSIALRPSKDNPLVACVKSLEHTAKQSMYKKHPMKSGDSSAMMSELAETNHHWLL